ncbi:hypothetical protein O181_081050 [Austropuccinia psidii MF-1]|uniref:Uncharacterized protein n=1 Tax=Austropuccinia psidii MF-1 TaxID=1389203 RepID=A0A9Q3FI77_9BASI|nr:hypothetical protein [Austropuccinia psidii MF-1]
MLDKARHHANRCMQDYFKYAKVRWDKSHKPPDFKVRDFILVSTINFNNIKGPKKLKYSFVGPSLIRALPGPNAVKLESTGELMSKHSFLTFILINIYSSGDKEFLSLGNKTPIEIPLPEEGGEKRL